MFEIEKSSCRGSTSNEKFCRLTIDENSGDNARREKYFRCFSFLASGIGLLSSDRRKSVVARNLTGWCSVGSTRRRAID